MQSAAPRGQVSFNLRERAARVLDWAVESFGLRVEQARALADAGAHNSPEWLLSDCVKGKHAAASAGAPGLDARFLHVRTGGILRVSTITSQLVQASHAAHICELLQIVVEAEHGGTCTIGADDIALAGEIIQVTIGSFLNETSFYRDTALQSLTSTLGIRELESVADFPTEMAAFKATLARLEDASAQRGRLTGDMAEQAGRVKTLVIQVRCVVGLSKAASVRPCRRKTHGCLAICKACASSMRVCSLFNEGAVSLTQVDRRAPRRQRRAAAGIRAAHW
jgi:hypothetical protein